MKNYIDVKITIWNRFYFSEHANMPGIVDLIKENGLDEVIDGKLGFIESKTLFDTEERLGLVENDDQSTIVVYEEAKEIWNNEIKK